MCDENGWWTCVYSTLFHIREKDFMCWGLLMLNTVFAVHLWCTLFDITVQVLADRLSMYMHAYTLYSFVRPFGCSILLAGYDKTDGADLYSIEPSGVCNVWLNSYSHYFPRVLFIRYIDMHAASFKHSSLSVNMMSVCMSTRVQISQKPRGWQVVSCPRGVTWSHYWWHHVTWWHHSGDIITFKMLFVLELLSELDHLLA